MTLRVTHRRRARTSFGCEAAACRRLQLLLDGTQSRILFQRLRRHFRAPSRACVDDPQLLICSRISFDDWKLLLA